MQIRTSRFGRSLAGACLCAALAQAALAVEVGGVKLDDTVQLASRELKLNGAGVRYKVIFTLCADLSTAHGFHGGRRCK